MTELQSRILSGVLLGALALGCVIEGGNFFFLLLAVLCVGCLYEGYFLIRNWPGRIAFAFVVLFAFSNAYFLNQSLGWIRFLGPALTIILTDVGAYFIGRAVGGPKLAPNLSPNKTWAGAIGGLGLSLVGAVIFFYAVPGAEERLVLPAILVTTVLASVAAQAGDLAESWLKRRAGVKDSGNLIPGHGGILDRLDSWIGAFFVIGLINLVMLGVVTLAQ